MPLIRINDKGRSLEEAMIRDFEREAAVLRAIPNNSRYSTSEQQRATARLAIIEQSVRKIKDIQKGGHVNNLFGNTEDGLSKALYEQFITQR